jgi:heme a synthase
LNTRSYTRYTWFVIIMVFLVIIAGGIVRTTQSGMGCPDWPKCFGMWVPPTDASQLPPDFEKYLDKQSIDHSFNVYHTWIEYINRLLGALLGLFIFIHLIWSWLKFFKTDKKVVLLSFLLLITVGFQGWLGKKVVDANLAVVKITIHMLVAILIAAIPLVILNLINTGEKLQSKFLKTTSLITIILLLVQITFGTQVREQIDEISKSFNYTQRALWVDKLDNIFIIHRSFSWVILAISFFTWYKAKHLRQVAINNNTNLVVVIITMLAGVLLAYFNMPAAAQPLHLFMACVAVICTFNFYLKLGW